tara:strand:+ start:285 stop:1379 length:1095 start_codon:yes stop_codon:yes gene_type:complete
MFWDSPEINKTILIIPNYTFPKDLGKDSFVDVIYQHIKQIEGVQWILPVPKGKGVGKLNLPNVTQVQCNISGDKIKMRSMFPEDVIKLIKKNDYDCVYSHLPDWDVGRYTNKPIIGYSHWWEMKECNGTSWLNYTLNLSHELINILQFDVCYLNTHHQKRLVLDNAKEVFNDTIVSKLDSILKVMNLSVNKENIVEKPAEEFDKVVVFNHRTQKYKGWDKFLTYIEKYREHRTDFKVWVPLLDKPVEHSWIDSSKYDKEQYLQLLSKCGVGVQPKQTHAGWSVSATDCMMRGLPMLFEEQDCYYEIDSNANTYKGYKQFEEKMDRLLDDVEYRMECGIKGIEASHKLTQNDSIKKLQKSLVVPN